jgi:acetoin utilization protein AcuB
MSHNPVYVHPELSVNDARSLMDKNNIGRLPVLDKSDKLVGILTRKDLLRAGPSQATTLDIYEISYLLAKLKVEKIMERNVITVDENEVIEEAARIMVDRNISCLPVMKIDGKTPKLAGIITATDLFRVFINAFGARRAGVRITVSMKDKVGQIAELSAAIAAKGGNIASLITAPGDEIASFRETIKIENISKDEIENIINGIGDMEIEDIRE